MMDDILKWLLWQAQSHKACDLDSMASEFLRAAEEIKRLRAIVDPLEQLRQSPGASVEIFLDVDVNFDVDDTTLSIVLVSDDWTHWRRVRFEGKSLADALANALKAREAARKGQAKE